MTTTQTTETTIPAYRLEPGQTFTLPGALGGGTYTATDYPTGEFNTYIDAVNADGKAATLYIRDGFSVTVQTPAAPVGVLNVTPADPDAAETDTITKGGKEFKRSSYKLPARDDRPELHVTEYVAETGGKVIVERWNTMNRTSSRYYVQDFPGDNQRRFAAKRFDEVMAAL